MENGVYYVGEWKFGFRHGKGVLHYADGKIKYKGDWINGKFDGNITKDNLKIMKCMEKELFILQMENFYMKVTLLILFFLILY